MIWTNCEMKKETSCGDRIKMNPLDIKAVAIMGIVILESIALWKGRDGKLLALGFALIGGLAGYEIGINV